MRLPMLKARLVNLSTLEVYDPGPGVAFFFYYWR
jgi:hypothetical protein